MVIPRARCQCSQLIVAGSGTGSRNRGPPWHRRHQSRRRRNHHAFGDLPTSPSGPTPTRTAGTTWNSIVLRTAPSTTGRPIPPVRRMLPSSSATGVITSCGRLGGGRRCRRDVPTDRGTLRFPHRQRLWFSCRRGGLRGARLGTGCRTLELVEPPGGGIGNSPWSELLGFPPTAAHPREDSGRAATLRTTSWIGRNEQ